MSSFYQLYHWFLTLQNNQTDLVWILYKYNNDGGGACQ